MKIRILYDKCHISLYNRQNKKDGEQKRNGNIDESNYCAGACNTRANTERYSYRVVDTFVVRGMYIVIK